jgi:hypothetical protein
MSKTGPSGSEPLCADRKPIRQISELRRQGLWLSGLAVILLSPTTWAQEQSGSDTVAAPERPAILFNRWQEDWSVLADPALRTEPLDSLKYISLSADDPHSYISFGVNFRDRVESTQIDAYGIGDPHSDTYLIQRLEFHADIRPDEHWQLFVQLQDDREWGKAEITPVDSDPLDLEQAFVAYTHSLAGGELKLRVGRQQMAFDLQRFIGVRDGPNVRQSFDAVWANWEKDKWRLISFWSHPVQDLHNHPFDDYSTERFQYGGFRVEREDVGPGKLSVYYSRYDLDDARYLFASGNDRRDILDVRYQINRGGVDGDLEVMRQTGWVGSSRIQAWAASSRDGYTFDTFWSPRIGVQLDFASGERRPGDGSEDTFNPLFPNAYYFTLDGSPTYANLIHVRPSLQVKPVHNLLLLAGVGLQWRETTADAVYVIPNIPVAGTAGRPGHWTGSYEQVRAEWSISEHWSAAIEGVQYEVGNVIRQAGGLNANYLGVEARFGW